MHNNRILPINGRPRPPTRQAPRGRRARFTLIPMTRTTRSLPFILYPNLTSLNSLDKPQLNRPINILALSFFG